MRPANSLRLAPCLTTKRSMSLSVAGGVRAAEPNRMICSGAATRAIRRTISCNAARKVASPCSSSIFYFIVSLLCLIHVKTTSAQFRSFVELRGIFVSADQVGKEAMDLSIETLSGERPLLARAVGAALFSRTNASSSLAPVS